MSAIGDRMSLRLEAHAGAEVSECCSDAHRVAVALGVVVRFEHNGVDVLVLPSDRGPDVAASRWWSGMNANQRAAESKRATDRRIAIRDAIAEAAPGTPLDVLDRAVVAIEKAIGS